MYVEGKRRKKRKGRREARKEGGREEGRKGRTVKRLLGKTW